MLDAEGGLDPSLRKYLGLMKYLIPNYNYNNYTFLLTIKLKHCLVFFNPSIAVLMHCNAMFQMMFDNNEQHCSP